MSLFLRRLPLFAAVILVACAAGVAATSRNTWSNVATVCLLLGAAVIAYGVFTVVVLVRQQQLFSLPEERFEPVEAAAVLREADSIFAKVPINEAKLFSELIVNPYNHFQRIAESVTPMEGYLLVSTKLTISVPVSTASESGTESPILLPLLTKERGQLSDGLKILNGDGKRVSSVIQREALGYYVACCRRLASAAGVLARYSNEVEPLVVQLVSSPEQVDVDDYFELLDRLYALPARNPEHVEVLALLLGQLGVLYPILVAAPRSPSATTVGGASQTLRYTVDQDVTLISSSLSWRNVRAGLRPLVMLAVGVRSNIVHIPLDNAVRAESYHVQCNGLGDGMYLGDQHLEKVYDGSSRRIKARRGQAYSHLYLQGARNYRNVVFTNWFYEVPPGSTGFAVAVAAMTLFGITVLGLNHLHWSAPSSLSPATLLLGLPGAIAAFLGIGRTAGALGGSIQTRASTFVSLIIALCGLLIAAAFTRNTQYYAGLYSDDLEKLPFALVVWMTVLVAQLLNLIWIGTAWLARSYIYWLARRS